MRIFVSGSYGRLGRELMARLADRHETVGADNDTLDIGDFAAVKARMAAEQPDLVINAAAWTDVDGCAREPQKAMSINGLGAQNLAVAAAHVGAAVVQVSTNEVFDGQRQTGYFEVDETRPLNPYAYSKWYAERAVMQTNPRHYIVRTAWLFAHGGRNFIQAIMGAAAAGKPIRVVTNEVANPTYTNDLADAIIQLIETGRYGTYHLVNEGACSRHQFARYILDRTGYADTPAAPISASEWPRPSTPPAYTALHNLAGASVGVTLRPWREAVDAFLMAENLLDSETASP